MARRPILSALLVVGVSGNAVGVYLPWVQTNPSFPATAEVPTVLLDGMLPGIRGLDFVLLGGAGLVPVLYVASVGEGARSVLTVLSGLGTVLLCLYRLSATPITGFDAAIGFDATFVPAEGWYLTVLGGVLLTVAGAVQRPDNPVRKTLRTALTN